MTNPDRKTVALELAKLAASTDVQLSKDYKAMAGLIGRVVEDVGALADRIVKLETAVANAMRARPKPVAAPAVAPKIAVVRETIVMPEAPIVAPTAPVPTKKNGTAEPAPAAPAAPPNQEATK